MIGSLSGRLLRGERRGTGCLIAFGAVFFLVGGFFVVLAVIKPFVQAQMARDWVERPCRILSSEVRESSDSDGGTTYGVNIRYEYTVNDRRYEGDRYDFLGGSDSNRGEKRWIVQRYPAGSEAVCWVDPGEPSKSVLNREFVFRPFLTLFVLIHPTVGLGVMYVAIRRRWAKVEVPEPKALPAKPRTLVSAKMAARAKGVVLLTSNERNSLVGLVVGCLIWNGIVGTAVFLVLRKGLQVGLLLFLSIFVLVGLFLLYMAFRKALEARIPRPALRLDADRLAPGGAVELSWSFSGDTGNTVRLKLTLVGRESATYRRGTSTVTDKSVFVRMPVADTSSPMQIQRGKVSMAVPCATMHTFSAPNNAVEWVIELEQEIPDWPDVKCEYSVAMNLPASRVEEVGHA